MADSGGMDDEEKRKKKLNDDVVVFLRKRSETESPRYTARLKGFVNLQHKKRKALKARHRSEQGAPDKASKKVVDSKDKIAEGQNDDNRLQSRSASRPLSRAGSGPRSPSRPRTMPEPEDRCGRRRRRRSCRRRRRRRRSCRRRRRRRRRRSCRRRHRRSCSRRRRRRSRCRRRRRSRRRRRC